MTTDVMIASWRYKMKGKTGLPYQLVFVPTTKNHPDEWRESRIETDVGSEDGLRS